MIPVVATSNIRSIVLGEWPLFGLHNYLKPAMMARRQPALQLFAPHLLAESEFLVLCFISFP
jgi:hypothetical protein